MIQSPSAPQSVRFPHPEAQSFSKVLRQRINTYFRENGLSKKANSRMTLKGMTVLGMYFAPYILMLVLQPGFWGTLGCFFLMGLGMSGVGMNVMHDAVHGAYHGKNWINKLLGSSIYLISGNATTWYFQHNILHHTYTNIEGLDEDLETRGLVRMHPAQERKPHQRYQMWYAPLLYGLLTLNWVVMKDFAQLLHYERIGVAKFTKAQKRREWITLIFTKLLYFGLFVALPIILLPVPWYGVLLAFGVMHFTAGFILSFVFQLAHVVDHVETFHVPEAGQMEDAWMEHQMRTTSNFARKSRLVSWYVGGLNFQIEHHLFPNICHIHYPALSPIVEKTAREFGVPYREHTTLGDAIRAHLRALDYYGKKD